MTRTPRGIPSVVPSEAAATVMIEPPAPMSVPRIISGCGTPNHSLIRSRTPSLKRVIVHGDWYKACVRKRNVGRYAGLAVAGVVVLTPGCTMKGQRPAVRSTDVNRAAQDVGIA